MNYTPKQLQILQLLFKFQQTHGYSPTYAELARKLHVSTITVFEHLTALEKKQAVRRRRHEARSIEIVDQNFLKKAELEYDSSPGMRLPLVGRIAAGSPIEAIETHEDLNVGDLFESNGECYMLEVVGDSMIDDHICNGDMVVIKKQQTAKNGEIIVALLDDGTATLKRYYLEKDGVRLQPANSTMEPIFIKGDITIQGIVKGVVRRCN